MTREDLFAAIGMMEESRLERTEYTVTAAKGKSHKRVFRHFLIAAIVVSMLAVTGYAVAGYMIFENPEAMITAIFGDKTGFDHKGVTTWSDPEKPGSVYENPGFDRVPVDETILEQDIIPHISLVGQSISQDGYTLSVDGYMYDARTGCGFVTFMLENPLGVTGYKVENNGLVWFTGIAPYNTSLYGKTYIIKEKTTDTCLALTFYFLNQSIPDQNLMLSFPRNDTLSKGEMLKAWEKQVRQDYTPEEAIQKAKNLLGEEGFKQYLGGLTGQKDEHETWETYVAYEFLKFRMYEDGELLDAVNITIPLRGETLSYISIENGSIIVTPISFQIDITELEFLHTNKWGDAVIHADNVDSVIICYKDGTEYVVKDEAVENYVIGLIDSASKGEKDMSNRLSYVFNRIINVDAISAVIVNGVELPVS